VPPVRTLLPAIAALAVAITGSGSRDPCEGIP